MGKKLIAETRIRYKGITYEPGNSLLVDSDKEADELIRDKQAREYPKPIKKIKSKDLLEKSYISKPGKSSGKNVNIITAIKDNLEYLERCITAVYKNTYESFEYIIIDNGSNREVKNYLINLHKRKSNINVITNKENMGYAYACNQGIKLASYDYICMLDADTYVSPYWLRKLLKTFKIYPDCGIVAPSQSANSGAIYLEFALGDINNIQNEIAQISSILPEEYEEKQIFQIYGFCHLVKREVYEKIGVYDWKRYKGLAGNETDLFWRAGLKGYKLYWAKGSYVYHFHNKIKISLGLDPQEMCDKGHKEFFKRRNDPDNFFVENDAEIRSNIGEAYKYNETFQSLKPYFNE